jgi:hypothetical protein
MGIRFHADRGSATRGRLARSGAPVSITSTDEASFHPSCHDSDE